MTEKHLILELPATPGSKDGPEFWQLFWGTSEFTRRHQRLEIEYYLGSHVLRFFLLPRLTSDGEIVSSTRLGDSHLYAHQEYIWLDPAPQTAINILRNTLELLRGWRQLSHQAYKDLPKPTSAAAPALAIRMAMAAE